MENEITVLVTCDYKTLHTELKNYKFKVTGSYQINDIYLINKTANLHNKKLCYYKKCIRYR